MAQQKYAKGSIFFNGVLLAEAQEITVEHRSGGQNVDTIEKGRAGRSPGAKSSMVRIKSAVPVAGTELDFVGIMLDDEQVDIIIFAHGKKKTYSGFIDTESENYGVSSASAHDVSVECGPPTVSAL